MSLKIFHIFFIGASIALALGFGSWEIRHFIHSKNPLELLMGAGSIAVSVSLVIYLRWFVQRRLR